MILFPTHNRHNQLIPNFTLVCIARLRHNAALEGGGGDVHKKYKEDVKAGRGGHENHEGGLPDYIKIGSLEEKSWRRKHPDNKKVRYFLGIDGFAI